MASTSLSPSKEKMPGILILFCLSTILGFLSDFSSVLTMDNQFQSFYACCLIFPIIRLLGIYRHSNKILFAGFYSAILFRIIEYTYAGFIYGFDKLFSVFGTDIAGYFISVAIWWSYFYFSKKAAAYFHVSRATSLSTPSIRITCPAPITENIVTTSSDVSQDSSNESLLPASSPFKSSVHFNHYTKIAIVIFALASVAFGALFIHQYLLYANSLAQIQSLSSENQSLTSENKKLRESITVLQNENASLQSSQNDSFVTSMQFYYLKNQIRFILDDGTRAYHTYDCPIYQNYSGAFWIHNPEYCESLGYYPCPVCSNQ